MLASLLRLLDCKPFKGKRGPEDDISIGLANELRAAALEGRLSATFTSIPHEVGAVSRSSKGLGVAMAKYSKQKAMGMVTGSADFVFVWPDGGGWIELKTKTGSLTPAQKDFREWCATTGCRHAVCRSVEDAVATLISWKVLRTSR